MTLEEITGGAPYGATTIAVCATSLPWKRAAPISFCDGLRWPQPQQN